MQLDYLSHVCKLLRIDTKQTKIAYLNLTLFQSFLKISKFQSFPTIPYILFRSFVIHFLRSRGALYRCNPDNHSSDIQLLRLIPWERDIENELQRILKGFYILSLSKTRIYGYLFLSAANLTHSKRVLSFGKFRAFCLEKYSLSFYPIRKK